MIHYIYDGTFEGLLTSIYEAYYRYENPDDIVPEGREEENFLIQRYRIETDAQKASKVYKSIEEKISEYALQRVFYVYLSDNPKSGIAILNYLSIGYKMGANVDRNLSNDAVLTMDRVYHKVATEKHRLVGLLRFKMLESGFFYSSVEPEHNIVGLLAPHFANRLSNENWIIHDLERNIAVLYNRDEWIIKDFILEDDIIIREDEEEYQDMWRAYYKHISIESRKNLRLKKNYMPMKYWKHLVEIN